MKNQFQQNSLPIAPEFDCEPIALHRLVSRVQAWFLTQTVAKKSFIVNEVDENLFVLADEDILGYVLGNLISNALQSTSDCCIRVETVSRGSVTQIVVRNNGKFTYSPGMHSLLTMSTTAHKLGGIICLQNEPKGGYTVVLSMSSAA